MIPLRTAENASPFITIYHHSYTKMDIPRAMDGGWPVDAIHNGQEQAIAAATAAIAKIQRESLADPD
jgi:hypothetical protein